MSWWNRVFGGKDAAGRSGNGCANCGGGFEWPMSFKSGPIPIPAHVADKAIFCQTCRREYCIKCVRGKCPTCSNSGFDYVVPGSSRG